MPVPLLQIDAFTARPYAGNPAAVAILDGPADEAWMRAVAAEMNLSETAFVHPGDAGTWDLRWFTPTVEVDLCGHATLATAHALWSTGRVYADDALRFRTRSGELRATPAGKGRIALDLPVAPAAPADAPQALLAALGVLPTATGYGDRTWLVEVATEGEVRACRPDVAALAAHEVTILTAPSSGPDADVVCRVFGPSVGIDEDPATGSAQCALVPWWAERLGVEALVTHQVSARGGELQGRLRGDRVEVAGAAVTVLVGELVA
jgi:PhzF family phenazine biosynthesis protein